MPSIIIHEKIGEFISKKKGISSYDYYLGILAPDTPNLEGFAPKEERWMAHQRKKDYNEWRESIYNFYQKEKENYPKDFLLGYYIHVVTDIVYDDYFYLKVREKIEKKYSKEESHTKMREDMNKYSFDDISIIKKILDESTNSYDILNIKKDTLLKWKEKEMSSWNHNNESKYMTEEIIEELEQSVLKEIEERLEI